MHSSAPEQLTVHDELHHELIMTSNYLITIANGFKRHAPTCLLLIIQLSGSLGDLIWRFNRHFTGILSLLTTAMDLAMQLMQIVLLPCKPYFYLQHCQGTF